MDGSAHDSTYYTFAAEYYYGYNPESGGMQTEYIDDLGEDFGGMEITEYTGTGSLQMDGSSGLLPNGDRLMMKFDAGADHAVVVTGVRYESGGAVIEYYDPTTGQVGESFRRL